MCSGDSAGNNSNEGLSDPPLSYHASFSQPTPPVTAFTPNKSVYLLFLDDPDFDSEAELPSLEAIIPKDSLRKLKPKEKKRQEVINGTLCFHFISKILCCLFSCRN